jgi:PIN domain nuclease of toxin-antitoxin system
VTAPQAPPPDAPLLLDTHIWIWAMEGDAVRLGPGIVARIEAAAEAGGIRIHPLSVWEVGMLVRKGRLALARPVEEWVDAALSLPGVTLLPVTAAIALEAARLPDTFPGDPVDRMLVAAARLTGAVLVTRDRRIVDSAGALGEVAVLPA